MNGGLIVHRTLAFGALVVLASCTVLVDDVAEDGSGSPNADGRGGQGGVGLVGTGAHGATTGSGTGGELPWSCQEGSPPDVGGCPAACTGGCVGGRCIIACLSDKSCKDATLACPESMICEVQCRGANACEQAAIVCPGDQKCEVVCEADKACLNATISVSDGPLDLICGADSESCKDMQVDCGGGACKAVCFDDENLPNLNCEGSCSCQPCGDGGD